MTRGRGQLQIEEHTNALIRQEAIVLDFLFVKGASTYTQIWKGTRMQRNRLVKRLEGLIERGWIEKLPPLTPITEIGGRRIVAKIEDIRAPPNYAAVDIRRESLKVVKDMLMKASNKARIDPRRPRETVADAKYQKRVHAAGRQISGYQSKYVNPSKLRYYSLAKRQYADFKLELDPTELFKTSHKEARDDEMVERMILKVGYALSKVPKELFAWRIMSEWDKWTFTQSEIEPAPKAP